MSGRTDKNVHAIGQVFHKDISKVWSNRLDELQKILNRKIPNSIKIQNLAETSSKFHARFSAKKRTYRYIFSGESSNPFSEKFISSIDLKNFDLQKAKIGIELFKGIHDFKNFSKEGSEPKSTIREIYETRAYQYRSFYVFKFSGNSFLRSQVRFMVATIIKFAKNELSENDIFQMLERNRKICFKPAPANGLYLWKIQY
ncbi:pseudouridylate synthase I [Thiovulum sp. ES]|nr:pseudouridylate synthase I [Thiovulum sp. ES]